MYKDGITGIKYKPVSARLRREITVRVIKKHKESTNPMVLDLLDGKTLFAYGEPGRPQFKFGALYSLAANNNRTLRVYQYDDVDDGIFKGYLMWMERGRK